MTLEPPSDRASGEPQSARPSKPTPVRAMDEAGPLVEEPVPPVQQRSLPIDDRVWTVEAAGQVEGPGGSRLMLIRFSVTSSGSALSEADPAGDSDGDVEAWMVADTFAAVTDVALAEAFVRAAPWRGAETETSFFAEEGGRRGR